MKFIKKILTITMSLSLMLTAGVTSLPTVSYADDTQLKHHLDMGVYVVNKQDGKWVKGGLGETVSYPTSLTFPTEIEIQRAMPLSQAIKEGVWKWKNTSTNTTGYGNTKESYYDNVFCDYVSMGQSSVSIQQAKGKTVKLSQSVVLKGNPTYDIVSKYNQYLNTMETTKQVVVSEKNQSILKQLASLRAQLKDEQYTLGRLDRELVPEVWQKQNKLCKSISAKIAKLQPQASKYTTVEQVVQATSLDVNAFLNEVYKFWGGSAGLKATNLDMWNMMQNMSQLKAIPAGTEYYLVFIPTVIEYKEAIPTILPAPPSYSNCDGLIVYYLTATKTHTVSCGDGCSYTCHDATTYKYTVALKTTLTQNPSKAFKSGYGFSANVSTSATTKVEYYRQAQGKHKVAARASLPVVLPNTATVSSSWGQVKYKTSPRVQPATISMSSSGNGKFTTAANSFSTKNSKLIYTPLTLKDGAHTYVVKLSGGGVGSIPWCATKTGTIYIKGAMTEDYSNY